ASAGGAPATQRTAARTSWITRGSEEGVIERQSQRVLGLPGRHVPGRAVREDLVVRGVVPVLEPADQPLPDLVLDRRGDLVQLHPGPRSHRERADAVGVLEVLEPDR